MNKKLSIMLLAGAIGCATEAFASSTATVTFTNLPYTDLNGDYGSAGATYNGYVIATVNGTPDQLLICDDYLDETYVPSGPLTFDYSTLDGPGNPAGLHFGGVGNAQTLYDEAAVLDYDLYSLGSHASSTSVTDYQYAIWNLFDPSVALNSSQQALQANALAAVDSGAGWLTAVYVNTQVYTPDPRANSAGNQEFLAYQVQTPEPATYLLVGALLTWLGTFRRRRI
ncbi:MAG: PEP-CTERM sorting domain-containing protein [Bryobacteraceae bacterium]|jgi:hypothetical protein